MYYSKYYVNIYSIFNKSKNYKKTYYYIMINYDKYIKYKTKYLQSKFKSSLKGDSNNIKEIYIIRHGETEWNKLGKGQGQEADIELNETGINQAKLTGKYLKDFRISDKKFDCIISSPMVRCTETSNKIADEIYFDRKNITLNKNIKELKKGNMSGLTKEDKKMIKFNEYVNNELNKIKDPIKKYEIQNPENSEIFFQNIIKNSDLNITNVETKDEIIERTNKFIEYIKELDCNKIIIVSHSGFIEILLKTLFNLNNLPKGNMDKTKNCSICYIVYKNDVFSMISPQNTEHL